MKLKHAVFFICIEKSINSEHWNSWKPWGQLCPNCKFTQIYTYHYAAMRIEHSDSAAHNPTVKWWQGSNHHY